MILRLGRGCNEHGFSLPNLFGFWMNSSEDMVIIIAVIIRAEQLAITYRRMVNSIVVLVHPKTNFARFLSRKPVRKPTLEDRHVAYL